MPSEVDDYLGDKLNHRSNVRTMIPGIGTDGAVHTTSWEDSGHSNSPELTSIPKAS